MAVINSGIIVSPTVEFGNPTDPDFGGSLTLNDLDSTLLEPGFYTIKASKTIDGQTASIWNVTCLGDNTASSPKCYMQIWIPASDTGLTAENQNIYVRTINAAGTGFGSFTTFVNKEYLNTNGAINKTGNQLEIYAQNSQPTATAGKTIIWIDTSN